MRHISVSVETADALEFPSDVLALKYAQALYGVDLAVYRKLADSLGEFRLPELSEVALLQTTGIIRPDSVLFVGVQPLFEFGYQEIREFARSILASLAVRAPSIAHLSLTIHGANYGLDEIEVFKAEIAGIFDALTTGDFPDQLTKITFVERDDSRTRRLQATLRQLLPNRRIPLGQRGALGTLAEGTKEALRTAGSSSNRKSHVFVAMPFAKEMDDLFHYGIQGAVNAAGLLCERADLSAFTGDVMEWVKTRIASANLVLADLSTSNPNVYLEVGYAWGCRVPTVLIVRDTSDLKFDVRGQRCVTYTSIKHLEDLLRSELQALQPTLEEPQRQSDTQGNEKAFAKATVYYDRVPPRDLRSRPQSGAPIIMSQRRRWRTASTLRVRFMGGSSEQHEAVRKYAAEWTQYANLTLQFTDAPDAEIRVAFDETNGSWSYIGTDSRDVPFEAPTMNLAIVDQRTVLHQFGRAIGLEPEHQNPAGGIQWNEQVVLRDLSGAPNYWDPDTARREYLEKYSGDRVNGMQFDPDSIMLLPIPAGWTLNGLGTQPNEVLSARDKALVQTLYPRSKKD